MVKRVPISLDLRQKIIQDLKSNKLNQAEIAIK